MSSFSSVAAAREKATDALERIAGEQGLKRLILLFDLLETLSTANRLVEISSPGFDPDTSRKSSDRIGRACK